MFLIPADSYQIKTVRKKGRGVFARKDIPAGTVIGDYLGKIVTDQEAEHLEEAGHLYALDYNGENTSIFPINPKAPGVHLINHACAPNLESSYVSGHNLFFAIRKIFAGEELTLDYGFDPEDEGPAYPCFCGSEFCRGTCYASVEQVKRSADYFDAQRRREGRVKFLPIGSILPPLSKYPKSVGDLGFYDLYANSSQKPLKYTDAKLPGVKEIRRRIREAGRPLWFAKLGFTVIAVVGDKLVIKK